MSNPQQILHAKNHPLAGPGAALFVDSTSRTVVNITADLGAAIDVNSVDDAGVIPDDGYIHADPGNDPLTSNPFDRSQYYANRQLTLLLAGGGTDCVVSLHSDGNNEDDDETLDVALTAGTAVRVPPPGDQITRVTTDVPPGAIITVVAGDTLCAGCRGVTLAVGASITVRLAREGDAGASVAVAKPITLPAGDNFRMIASVPEGGISAATAQLYW